MGVYAEGLGVRTGAGCGYGTGAWLGPLIPVLDPVWDGQVTFRPPHGHQPGNVTAACPG